MGGGRWDVKDWKTFTRAASYDTKSTNEIYSSRKLDNELSPKGVKIRESRDSEDNPQSNAVIIALDVTGSMGAVLDVMARTGLNTLVTQIYDRKPVTDPHIMCMGIGDVEYDRAPLQVTQFEADIRIAKQLEKLFLEMGGGGNNYESYTLAWYFAAMHTSIDCFEKRGKKGYLFTIGDEGPTPSLASGAIKGIIGEGPQMDMSGADLFTMVSRNYEVFHIMVEEGSYFRSCGDRVVSEWTKLLGQRAIRLSDHTKFAETVVSLIQVNEGASKESVVGSWDGKTALAVKKALNGVDLQKPNSPRGIVTFD